MSNIVLVTENCYLLCEKIIYISTNANSSGIDEFNSRRTKYLKGSKRKKDTRPDKLEALLNESRSYEISIGFLPVGASTNSNPLDEMKVVNIVSIGKDNTLRLYSEMVKQIREQIPDNLWLDKLVSEFFTEQSK